MPALDQGEGTRGLELARPCSQLFALSTSAGSRGLHCISWKRSALLVARIPLINLHPSDACYEDRITVDCAWILRWPLAGLDTGRILGQQCPAARRILSCGNLGSFAAGGASAFTFGFAPSKALVFCFFDISACFLEGSDLSVIFVGRTAIKGFFSTTVAIRARCVEASLSAFLWEGLPHGVSGWIYPMEWRA